VADWSVAFWFVEFWSSAIDRVEAAESKNAADIAAIIYFIVWTPW
jgi:hypothetical protein